LTFYPHPNVVLRGAEPFCLSTRAEKLALLAELDLDLIVIQPFTPGLAQTRAQRFVDCLVKGVGMVSLWVGPDFTLGYRREGDIAFLQQAGVERGFVLNVVQHEYDVSSSRIRQALRQGDVELAARGLGRPYRLQGPVIVGAQRGRTMGFPTANVEVAAEQAVPANGIYAAWARLDSVQGLPGQELHQAVVNIGTRPTFDNGLRTIEAHLIDFTRNIYGQRLSLDFIVRLRPEKRFDDVEALVAQIQRDVEQARQLLHV
jgi:riboflavin kinase/FMN adenylyltransferase